MKKVCIIGAGAYGLSIALSLSKKEYLIDMWVESKERCVFLNENRKNSGILPNKNIPKTITFTNDIKEIIDNNNLIIIAVAAKYVDSITKEINKYNIKNKYFAILSKGIEQNTCAFVSEVFKRNIKNRNLAVVSGPSFAVDLANNEPVGLSIAGTNKKTIDIFKRLLSSDTIKLRKSSDMIGIELCGSIKNIIAIASGILDGLGYKESTRSFLITESIHDIKSLIHGLGEKKKTILSYAGVGDLLLTATSEKSRNYSYGKLIGEKKFKESQKYLETNTVEGYYTLKSIYTLIKRKKIKMPIVDLIYQILFNNKKPEEIVSFLIKKV